MTAASWMGAFILLNSHVKDGVSERGWMAEVAQMYSVEKDLPDFDTFSCCAKIYSASNHDGKECIFRRNTLSLKPYVTEETKAECFAYAVEEVERQDTTLHATSKLS